MPDSQDKGLIERFCADRKVDAVKVLAAVAEAVIDSHLRTLHEAAEAGWDGSGQRPATLLDAPMAMVQHEFNSEVLAVEYANEHEDCINAAIAGEKCERLSLMLELVADWQEAADDAAELEQLDREAEAEEAKAAAKARKRRKAG